MKISMKLDNDAVLDHEMLMSFAPTLMALSVVKKSKDKDQAEEDAEGIVHDISKVFDHAAVELNGKTFRPRICWVDDNGKVLDGAADYEDLHDGAYGSLEDLDEIKIDRDFKAS